MSFMVELQETLKSVGASIGVPLNLDHNGVLNFTFGEDNHEFSLLAVERERTIMLAVVVAKTMEGTRGEMIRSAHRYNRENDSRSGGAIGLGASSNDLVFTRTMWVDIVDEEIFSSNLNAFLEDSQRVRDHFSEEKRHLSISGGGE